MPNILIRNVSIQTKERLRRRAERHGRSLEAELRYILENITRKDRPATQKKIGFGTWLASISRPGADLSKAAGKVCSASPRNIDFE